MRATLSALWERARTATDRWTRSDIEKLRREQEEEAKAKAKALAHQPILDLLESVSCQLRVVLDFAAEQGYSSVLDLSAPRFADSTIPSIGSILIAEDDTPIAHLVSPSKKRLCGSTFDHHAFVIPLDVNLGAKLGVDTFYLHIRISDDDEEELVFIPKWQYYLSGEEWPSNPAVLKNLQAQLHKFIHAILGMLKLPSAVTMAA